MFSMTRITWGDITHGERQRSLVAIKVSKTDSVHDSSVKCAPESVTGKFSLDGCWESELRGCRAVAAFTECTPMDRPRP